MKLMKCPVCGKDVSDDAAKCPHCGDPLCKRRPPRNRKVGFAGIAVMVFGVAAAYAAYFLLNLEIASEVMLFGSVIVGAVITAYGFSSDRYTDYLP